MRRGLEPIRLIHYPILVHGRGKANHRPLPDNSSTPEHKLEGGLRGFKKPYCTGNQGVATGRSLIHTEPQCVLLTFSKAKAASLYTRAQTPNPNSSQPGSTFSPYRSSTSYPVLIVQFPSGRRCWASQVKRIDRREYGARLRMV